MQLTLLSSFICSILVRFCGPGSLRFGSLLTWGDDLLAVDVLRFGCKGLLFPLLSIANIFLSKMRLACWISSWRASWKTTFVTLKKIVLFYACVLGSDFVHNEIRSPWWFVVHGRFCRHDCFNVPVLFQHVKLLVGRSQALLLAPRTYSASTTVRHFNELSLSVSKS